MAQRSVGSWIGAVVIVAAMAAAVWSGRHQLDAWTRERLAAKHARQLQELDEANAAALVAAVEGDDRRTLRLVVTALGDLRPRVAEAAEAALMARLERWKEERAATSSPRVATLANVLAERAASLPRERRPFLQQLAERLIAWPIDRTVVSPGRVIGACETVLRLEPLIDDGIRIASLEARTTETWEGDVAADGSAGNNDGLANQEAESDSLPPLEPEAFAKSPARLPVEAQQPELLPGAGEETAVQPRRFLPPKGVGSVSD